MSDESPERNPEIQFALYLAAERAYSVERQQLVSLNMEYQYD